MGFMPEANINDSMLLRSRTDLLGTSAGQTFGASFRDPLASPLEMGLDIVDVMKESRQIMDPFTLVGEVEAPENVIDDSEFMTPKEVEENEDYKSVGLKIDEPMPRSAVRLLAEQRRDQRVRDDIIKRGPYTVAGYAASFFGSTARSFTDPINIASAWFPVVSQARFAGLVAKHGAAKARLMTGLAEGLAGASFVEPAVFGMSKQLKLDYEMTDALMNIALGTALGGGLHLLGGTVKDRVTGRPIAEELATIARLGNVRKIRQLADDAFEAGDDVKGQALLDELDKLDSLGDIESSDTTDEGLRVGQNRALDDLDDDMKAELAATAVNQVVNNQPVDLDLKVMYGKLAQQKRRLQNRIKNLKLQDEDQTPEVPDSVFEELKQDDAALTGDAGRAVDRFVGGPHNAIELGQESGFANMVELDDAFSSKPTAKGKKIKAALTKAMLPIKKKLKEKFGETIRVFRFQGEIDTDVTTGGLLSDRNVLSYTTDKVFAEHLAGARQQDFKVYADKELDTLTAKLKKPGDKIVIFGERLVLEEKTIIQKGPNKGKEIQGVSVERADLPSDAPEAQITGILKEDVRKWIGDKNNERLGGNKESSLARSKVQTFALPIKDIVWVTDRFNQKEIIARNQGEAKTNLDRIQDSKDRLIAIEADQQKIVSDLSTKKVPRITKEEEAELEDFETRRAESEDGKVGLEKIQKIEEDDPVDIPKLVKDEPDPLEGMDLIDEDGNVVPARKLLDDANKLVEEADAQEAAIKKAGECLSGVT